MPGDEVVFPESEKVIEQIALRVGMVGAVMGQEVHELESLGVPIVDALGESLGMDADEVLAAVSRGEVDSEMFEASLDTALAESDPDDGYAPGGVLPPEDSEEESE